MAGRSRENVVASFGALPLYAVRAVRETGSHGAATRVFVSGGGGASKTGLKNEMHVFELDAHGTVSRDIAIDTGSVAVMNLDVTQQGNLVVCSSGAGSAVYQIDRPTATLVGSVTTDTAAKEPRQKLAVLSRAGTTLATAGEDGKVWLFDFPTLRRAGVLANLPKGADDIALHPFGTQIAVVSKGDRSLHVYRTVDCVRVKTIAADDIKTGMFVINKARYSPDGKHLIVGMAKKGGETVLAILNTDTYEVVHKREVYSLPLSAMTISPDGKYIALGCGEGVVTMHEADTLETIFQNQVHGFFIADLCFTPDSEHVLSVSVDATCRISSRVQRQGRPGVSKNFAVVLGAFVAFLAIVFMVLSRLA